MEITNVSISAKEVVSESPFTVSFSVIGAMKPFTFPFSNESLTENLIIFVEESHNNGNYIKSGAGYIAFR